MGHFTQTSMLDDSHDGASSRTRNAPTATQRTDPGTPVLIGDVSTTTEMPNNNCPPVLINSPRREVSCSPSFGQSVSLTNESS